MSNINVIQELYRTFVDKDYRAFRQICDPNLIWIQNKGFPDGSTNYGVDAVIENVFKAFDRNWSLWNFEIEKYLDADSSVIVIGFYQGTHQISGKSFRSDAAHLYNLANGKVTKFRQFADTKVIWDAMV